MVLIKAMFIRFKLSPIVILILLALRNIIFRLYDDLKLLRGHSVYLWLRLDAFDQVRHRWAVIISLLVVVPIDLDRLSR